MKTPLGKLLVEAGIITVKTLERALARQSGSGKRLGIVLDEMGVLTQEELIEALAKQFNFETVKGIASLSFPEAVSSRLKILVVDNSTEITTNIEGALSKEGYEVLTANDGVEGLKIVFSQHPDLILCDAAMPRMDGYALMRAIKANPASAATPMILLTSKASAEEEHRALKSGFHDFITKPMMAIRVVSRVKRAFEIRQEIRQRQTATAS